MTVSNLIEVGGKGKIAYGSFSKIADVSIVTENYEFTCSVGVSGIGSWNVQIEYLLKEVRKKTTQ
jgi:hypothetical protein